MKNCAKIVIIDSSPLVSFMGRFIYYDSPPKPCHSSDLLLLFRDFPLLDTICLQFSARRPRWTRLRRISRYISRRIFCILLQGRVELVFRNCPKKKLNQTFSLFWKILLRCDDLSRKQGEQHNDHLDTWAATAATYYDTSEHFNYFLITFIWL